MDVKLPKKCCDNPQRFVVAPVIGFECRNCGHRECINGNEELLKEMAEALSQIVAEVKKYSYHPSLEHMGPLVLDGEEVLQKYHEQKAANAK